MGGASNDMITLTNNIIERQGTSHFGRAVRLYNYYGSIVGNNLNGRYSIQAGDNGGGSITIHNNNLYGICEINNLNAAATFYNNDCFPSNAYGPGTDEVLLELKNISNPSGSLNIHDNGFRSYLYYGIFAGRVNNVTIDNNLFMPDPSASLYRSVCLNTKQRTSATQSAFTNGITLTRNDFKGNTASGQTGIAFEVANYDNVSSIGSVIVGTSGNENTFRGENNQFIVLNNETGPAPTTGFWAGIYASTMAKVTANIDGSNNPNHLLHHSPSAMTLAQLFALEDKIQHKIDDWGLGFVLVKANNAYVTDIATTAANNNDYTRIRNAVDYVSNNWTVNLHGSFNWTETNAAASWALGNDGVISVADDYCILVRPNLNGVTFTAPQGLSHASIQEPGDLPAVNLEGVLVFDGGDNQGWTISNMEILDFDMAIAMFNGAGGSDAFNNTIITNNHIRIATDLNAILAPADVNQNIGLHYSFGTNQTISNNVIDIPGNGVSDGVNYSTSVGMQSNTSGGAVYDGLKIKDNIITVTGVPALASPSVIRGIWENGANSDAAIEISGNIFTNANPANTANLNRQVAFWITSVSSATKKIEYKNNEVSGFNEGVAWIGGAYTSYGPPAYQTGQFPVEIKNNKFDGMMNAVVVRKAVASTNPDSPAFIENNSFTNFVSGGLAIKNEGTGVAQSPCNWFGTNTVAGVASLISGPVNYIPWLVDGTDNPLGGIGFQPLGTCTGATDLYVNDLVYVLGGDDIYTTAIGNDANPGTASAPFLTIMKAVNTAVVGTNIWLDAGTFQEQVSVGKTLNITGNDRTKTIVKAPAIIPTVTNANWSDAHPIIYAYGAGNNINISKIKIDGDGGRNQSRFYGVCYFEANGIFDNNSITGIRETVFNGSQNGMSFYGTHINNTSLTQTITVSNNTIEDYAKGGITINAVNTQGIIIGNTITGQNIPNVVAQNGVQISRGAWGSVTGNTITNNIWNKVEHPHVDHAAGILLYGVGVDNFGVATGKATVVGDNTLFNNLSGNEAGIMLEDGSIYGEGYTPNYGISLLKNTFSNNKVHVRVDNASQVNAANVYDKRVDNPAEDNRVYGCIQYAIDEASATETLNASTGTFIENVDIHTTVNLLGPQANNDPRLGRSGGEALIVPLTNSSLLGNIVNVGAANVVINGFTIDGDNPSLGGGYPLNGADVNAWMGINNGDWYGYGIGNAGLVAKYNIVKNARGTAIFCQGTPTVIGGMIDHNVTDNSEWGISISYNYYADITNNKVSGCLSCIQTQAFYSAGPASLIDNNEVHYYKLGLQYNDMRSGSGTFTISNNNFIAATGNPALLPNNIGMYFVNLHTAAGSTITGNNVTAGDYGIKIFDAYPNVLTVNGGTITGGKYGVLASTHDASWGDANVAASITGMTINSPTLAGIYIEDQDLGGPLSANLNISTSTINGNSITPAGVLVSGNNATANILNNTATITGNTTGVKVTNNASTSVNTSTITANGTGILVDLGGNLTSCANNFITSNTTAGVKIESTAGTIGTITINDLSGNPVGNAINYAKANPQLNATCNWFGFSLFDQVSGRITGNVDYIPWLMNGTDEVLLNQGFQNTSCGGNPIITGTFKYNNPAKTAMNGVTLRLMGIIPVDTATVVSGIYTFDDDDIIMATTPSKSPTIPKHPAASTLPTRHR